MKKRKITDWLLLVLFVLSAFSGIKLHVIGDTMPVMDHNRMIWSWIHGIVAITFVIFALLHLSQHLPWYKTLKKKAPTRNLRVRRMAVLSLDTLLAFLLISGLWLLLFPLGNFVNLGIAHYVIGLLLIVFALGHIIKRAKFLK